MSKPNEKLEALFEAAVALETEAQRAAYLNRACPDPELRREVESLLAAHQNPDSVFAGKTVRVEATPTAKLGDRIGRYKLLQQIGEGGCGVVYMAEQEEPVRRRVALKVIKLGMDTKQVIARFEAERQALAIMDHPNIAKVLDAGATETGRPYFVMELVRGVKITDFCDQKNLSTRARLDLFIQVCRAVQHAHQKGIIHRDLKPSNILVTSDDGVPVPKVIDFGIAKATQGRLTDHTVFTAFEQFIGTPAYMSPEQAEMSLHDVDTRTDVYSLGVLLYELLTGRTPFDQKELLAAGLDEMRRIIREQEPSKPSTRLTQELVAADVRRLKSKSESPGANSEEVVRASARRLLQEVRGDLDWIVMKCLEKDRARRYETANGLAADLTRHLNDEPVVARPPSRVYEFQKTVRRHKFGFAAAAAILLVLAGGIALTTWQAARARRAEREQIRLHAETEKAQQAEANRADAAQESKGTLSASDFLQGVRLIAEDNATDALPYLVRSLSANPTNDAALTRLATLLTYRTWMLPTVVMSNASQVNSVEFSADGTRIVTGSADGTARVWDAKTGQPVLAPMKHPSSVSSAEFSLVGNRLVTTSAETAYMWDAQSGQPVTELKKNPGQAAPALPNPGGNVPPFPTAPPADGVVSVQFSPDGKQLVTVSRDKSARVWDAQTGQPLSEPMKHTNGVTSAQFSPDGKRIETFSKNNELRVWDAQTGQLLEESMSHGSPPHPKEVSPDGKRRLLISSGRNVRVMDVQTNQPLTEPMPHEADVVTVRFSLDGQRVVTASRDNIVRVWEPQTAPAGFLLSPYWSIRRHERDIPEAAFSPDGRWIVMPGWGEKKIFVWDAGTGEALAYVTNHNVLNDAQFSPDGLRIVTADGFRSRTADGIVEASPDNTARVWDSRTGQPQGERMEHSNMIFSAQFSPDGTRILTASADQTARVWDAQTGQPLTGPMTHGDGLTSAEFTSDGKRILTLSERSRPEGTATVRVWDARTGQPLTEPMKHGGSFRTVQFSPDRKHMVTTSNGTARVWNAQTGQPLTGPMTHGDALSSAEFTSDGKRILTVSKRFMERVPATVRVWDVQTGQPLTLPVTVGGPGVDSAQFSPDGKRIVTAVGNTAQVWDAQTGKPLTEPMSTGTPANTVCSARFSSDGKRLLTTDGRGRIWDIAPTQAPCPDWLFQLAEAISGKVLNKEGVLEPTRLNRVETLNQIRQKLAAQPDDDWVVWGRWVLADRATRTISPFANITVPEQITRDFEGKNHPTTIANLEEVLQLSPTNTVALARLALLVKHPDPTSVRPPLDVAEHHARFAVKLAPGSAEPWHALGAVYFLQGRSKAALATIDRALELQPGNAEVWEIRGELLEKTNRLAEAPAAFTRQIELQPTTTNEEPAIRRIAPLHRASVLRKLDRLEEAAREISLACGIPPRDPQTPPALVDLSAFYNAGLQGNWHHRTPEGDLSELPAGLVELAGTRFDVRGLIQLRGATAMTGLYPGQTTGLPVPPKFRRVHFLHSAVARHPTKSVGRDDLGIAVGKYVFHYVDGTFEERPLVAGHDVRDWTSNPSELGATNNFTLAWTAPSPTGSGSRHLSKSTWENPKPDVELAGMDFISAGRNTAPFLVAITVE